MSTLVLEDGTEVKVLNFTSTGLKLFSYAIYNNNWQEVLDSGITKDFLLDNDDKVLHDFFNSYYDRYNHTPDYGTVIQNFPTFKVDYQEGITWESIYESIMFEKQESLFIDLFTKYNKLVNDFTISTYDRATALKNLYENEGASALEIAPEITFTSGEDICEQSRALFNRDISLDIIPSGLEGFDDLLNGWDKTSDYAIVAGRPGQGKSMLLCKFAAEAIKNGRKVGYYSGEMPANKVLERMLSVIYGISSAAIFKRDQSCALVYNQSIEDFKTKYGKNIFIVEPKDFGNQYPTAQQLSTFCRRCGIDMLIIDQQSFLKDTEKAKNTWDTVGNISRQVKAVKDKLGIPVIMAVEQNRSKEDGTISVSSLAGSDRLGADATKVIFVVKDTKEDSDETTCTLYLSKNRFGRQGKKTYTVNFDKGTWVLDNNTGTYIPDPVTEPFH